MTPQTRIPPLTWSRRASNNIGFHDNGEQAIVMEGRQTSVPRRDSSQYERVRRVAKFRWRALPFKGRHRLPINGMWTRHERSEACLQERRGCVLRWHSCVTEKSHVFNVRTVRFHPHDTRPT